MGLLDELRKYVKDALPGGLLNPEVSSQGVLDGAAIATTPVPVIGDLLGLGADLNRYKNEPESRTLGNFALSGLGMLPFVPAMTAWHGSPHKFDKFSLDKIGTGEGAQAYGHGLYLAESPKVAEGYKTEVSKRFGSFIDGEPAKNMGQQVWEVADDIATHGEGSVDKYIEFATKKRGAAIQDSINAGNEKRANILKDILAEEIGIANSLRGKDIARTGGHIYKTDIPDEAVARFLDWDKPVPEDVRQRISNAAMAQFGSGSTGTSGEHLYKEIARELGNPAVRNSSPDASAWLAAQGIPGIRYLDGGSRSAGQGSSNFVVFDDQLPRILERNGVPTGQQPWKPGEWQGLLGR